MVDFSLLPPSIIAMKAVHDLFSARFLLIFWCFYCYFQDLSVIGSQRLHPDEIAILKKIDSKFKIGWDFSVNPCSGKNGWQQDDTPGINNIQRNVTCGNCDMNNTCHVISIQLKTQNLTGSLPVEFANLTSLVVIDLTRNNFDGSIPLEWGSLLLTNLSLGINRISGKIPYEIGNISTLKSLVLENNLLQGYIPSSLGRLMNLRRLILSANDFTGQLPKSLGNLTNLTEFRIDGCDISGEIPSFIGNWTNLIKLHMQGTSLEGSFPAEISTLKSLVELLVSDLKGVGTFPSLRDKNLKKLILRNCSISGKLPPYIGEMTNLKILDLSFNNFTGEIPDSYRKLEKSTKNLYLTNNMLSGRIPDWIYNSKSVIDVSYNFFEQSSARSNCDQQATLVNTFASTSFLENRLVDPCLRKTCSSITNYNLFINCGGMAVNIGDDQYDEDVTLMGASTFYLSSNKKWAFSSTGYFLGNKLANYIATNSTVLSIRNPEIYMTARLSPSSLKYYGLCLQKGSYTVNLHFAEIMFVDGNTYYSVGRRYFDVSIQGQKVLKDFNIAADANGTGIEIIKRFNATVDDNTLVIGFRWSGKGTNSVPKKGVYGPLISAISVTPNFTPNTPNKGTRGPALGAIIGIVIGSIAGILLILLVLYFLLRRKYHEDNGLGSVNLKINQFSLRQIRSATGNFDHANKIGEGGFGPVFKGILLDGTPIAVKQLSSKSRQGNREFITEIGMISALQHPNLVKLLGCCIEGNQLLLVYEYMENNSLYHILFGPEDKRVKLDWKTRRNICLGVARGLAYLHEGSRIKIIHRDIKATNVLLDKDLNAKISDFGLAKLDDEQNTHMSTRIAGTRPTT